MLPLGYHPPGSIILLIAPEADFPGFPILCILKQVYFGIPVMLESRFKDTT